MKPFKYTDEQEIAIARMLDFLVSDQPTMVLEGPPGSGKSTILQAVVQRCGLRVLVTAPTNKAARVVRRMAQELSLDVECKTTYSALGLMMSTDDEIKHVFQYNSDDILLNVDLLVVDEGSMVPERLFEYTISEAASRNIKVLFIGDRYQIPPVKEKISKVFLLENKITLKTIERVSKDNPIIQVVTHIRECIDLQQYPRFKTAANDGIGVFTCDTENFNRYMRQGFASDTYKTKEDSFKSVAWRNETVNMNNAAVRQALYGRESLNSFVKGEKVIAGAPVMPPDDEVASMMEKMCTDDEGVIEDAVVGMHPNHPADDFKVWHLTISFYGGYVVAYVIHEDDKLRLEQKLQRMAALCRAQKLSWKIFWEYKESFNDIRPCHSITAHRSQGSTYENTFVDVNDIFANRNLSESLRILYVACSRSSHRLLLRVA